MLAVLGDYLKHLNSEIESYEELIAQKREEQEKLAQFQGQVVEALGLLKGIVDELITVEPNAIATIKTAALQIFENSNDNSEPKPDLPMPNDSAFELNDETSALEAENSFQSTEIDNSVESEPDVNLATVTDVFSNGKANQQGLEIGTQVIIHSTRYQGKYDGHKGAIASEPSNFGVKVDMGDETLIFFLKDEISLLD